MIITAIIIKFVAPNELLHKASKNKTAVSSLTARDINGKNTSAITEAEEIKIN